VRDHTAQAESSHRGGINSGVVSRLPVLVEERGFENKKQKDMQYIYVIFMDFFLPVPRGSKEMLDAQEVSLYP
jgi:hypothetical protein